MKQFIVEIWRQPNERYQHRLLVEAESSAELLEKIGHANESSEFLRSIKQYLEVITIQSDHKGENWLTDDITIKSYSEAV
ncbi:MAG TPA: hypothetical protein ENN84_00890 [Candidatus Marinimicrobia bacterium]|nr:hypothetical protein [Candidatus Neomarinimicrobiota bacterium]